MTVDSWLNAAIADAEQRGLPELKPLLEALARATTRLRSMDRQPSFGEASPRYTAESSFGGAGLRSAAEPSFGGAGTSDPRKDDRHT